MTRTKKERSNKKGQKQRATKSKVQISENTRVQKPETYRRETRGDGTGDDAGGKQRVASQYELTKDMRENEDYTQTH